MPGTIRENAEAFQRAVKIVAREGFMRKDSAESKAEPKKVADALEASLWRGHKFTRGELTNMARRAITAHERGRAMTLDPDLSELTKNIPENFGLYASQPRYEYVVVVKVGDDETGTAYTHVVRSNRRLSGDEAIARATREYMNYRSRETKSGERLMHHGEDENLQGFIISVSQRTPG